MDSSNSEVFINKILNNYKEFNTLILRIKADKTDTIRLEYLSWQLHNDILNFEYEAYQNLLTI